MPLDGRTDRLQYRARNGVHRLVREVLPPAAIVAQQLELPGREERAAGSRDGRGFGPGHVARVAVPHHDGVGGQVAQPLRSACEHDHSPSEHARHGRLEVDDAQHVADYRAPHREGLAGGVEHSQTERTFSGRLAVAQQLEQQEISPLQHEEAEHQHARGETLAQRHSPAPQQRVGHREQDQAAHDDRHVDQQGRQPRAHVGQLVVQSDVLGRLDPEPAPR